MKNILFRGSLLLVGLSGVIAATTLHKRPVQKLSYQKEGIISCGTTETDIEAGEDGKFIPVLPGWGHHSYTISTNNDSAQLYFDQGLSLYYGYHLKEALASFKEAARFDPNAAMAYWGQALSLGPYYNSYYYKMKKQVPDVMRLMDSHIANSNEKERSLIAAMQQRYSTDTTDAGRARLDSNYAAAMSLLIKKYVADDDIKTLYVDAVMLKHKWDFWNHEGEPKPWTPELVNLCEEVLKKDPQQPAALHYYIHLTEASRHPERALHSADILRDLMPGVGHMVHMSTHMYQRNGLFAKGVYVNEDANAVNNKMDSLAPVLGLGKNNSLHIYAVQSYCAMNAGMYGTGMPIYLRAKNRVLDLRTGIDKDAYSQYVYMMPVVASVRLGKWQEILAFPSPASKWKYASVLDNFAKGLAYVHNKNLVAAKQCLTALEQNLDDSLLNVREMPFNKPAQCCRIAASILKGSCCLKKEKQVKRSYPLMVQLRKKIS